MYEKNYVITSSKFLIEFDNKLIAKKDTPNIFDITIETIDFMEEAILVGIYLLDNISNEFPELMGVLYRDYSHFIIRKICSRRLELLENHCINL